MSYNELVEYNPWWKDASEIENDPAIRNWQKSKLKWVPRLIRTFQFEDLVYSLRGPRQVGKTTLVKLMIRDLLKTVPKWNVMYYSLEVENSPTDIINIIKEYYNRAKLAKSRKYIFLDEVSNVSNWQKAIKKLKDQGKLDDCTVIATGSHSIDLIHATELLPGRRGMSDGIALDKILPPIKFSEYVTSIDKKLGKIIEEKKLLSQTTRFKIIRNLARGEIDDSLRELSAYQNDLDKYFDDYLITGGLPIAVDQFIQDGFIKEDVYKIYLDFIKGDLNNNRKDWSYVAQIMPNIVKSLGSTVSWSSIQKHTDIGSHNTTKEYVEILSEMFVLAFFYRYNSAEKTPKYDAEKKIYFQDPLFLHAVNGWINQKDPFKFSLQYVSVAEQKAALVENVISDHMIRLAFNLSERKSSYDYHQAVFYWRGREDREVDFIVKDNDNLIPIEVKYQNTIKKEDYYGLFDFRKATGQTDSMMITKNELNIENNVALIPVSLFLLFV